MEKQRSNLIFTLRHRQVRALQEMQKALSAGGSVPEEQGEPQQEHEEGTGSTSEQFPPNLYECIKAMNLNDLPHVGEPAKSFESREQIVAEWGYFIERTEAKDVAKQPVVANKASSGDPAAWVWLEWAHYAAADFTRTAFEKIFPARVEDAMDLGIPLADLDDTDTLGMAFKKFDAGCYKYGTYLRPTDRGQQGVRVVASKQEILLAALWKCLAQSALSKNLPEKAT